MIRPADAENGPSDDAAPAASAAAVTVTPSTTSTSDARRMRGITDPRFLRGTSQISSIAVLTDETTASPAHNAPPIPIAMASGLPATEPTLSRIWVPTIGNCAIAESTMRAWSAGSSRSTEEATLTTTSISGNNEKKP